MTREMSPLAQLEAQVRADLAKIAHPRMQWLESVIAPDGKPAHDVVIVGAGQSGIATAFGLMRARVENIRVIDKAPRGREGPWLTYARMHTLRSPKDFTGPDLDVPSLTYQSWHEARFGQADWEALELIPRALWGEYLLWVRDQIGIPVDNETALVDIAPEADLLRLTLQGVSGEEIVHTRKLVLATGQESTGRWWMPEFVEKLPARFRAHTADEIDFDALSGKVVAVLGAGASSLDNAATALEAGAQSVHLFCRRASPQVVQPYRWLTFAGFLRNLSDLDDAWRWRFMRRVLSLREGFPQATWDRCARHANFHLHGGAAWQNARVSPDGRVALITAQGPFTADFLICGTGIENDYAARPELSRFAHNILSWGEAYDPPEAERDARLGRFPYLARDYSFMEREPGETPWIRHIHLFSIASTMSFGASGSSINAMTSAVPKLVNGITGSLFRDDVEKNWAAFEAYDVPQAVIRGVD
ncbi:MAG: FAD/NAD(P)-binding protein [Salinarimonas sp.]